MTLETQKKLAQHIFRLLKVNEIVFPIGRTNKGNLGLKFTEGNNDFEIMLDAVPLSTKDMLQDDNNIELKKMLEKYWFDSEKQPIIAQHYTPIFVKGELATPGEAVDEILDIPKKQRGRPKGSKNKARDLPKQEVPEVVG